MTTAYLSKTTVRLSGVMQHRKLAGILQKNGKGIIQTTAPLGVSEKKYEFYPYEIFCYHPSVEKTVIEQLEKWGHENVKFEIIRK